MIKFGVVRKANHAIFLAPCSILLYTSFMTSIFTKIINGEIPSYKIYEDKYVVAFLDINPIQKGHTLVVPRKEVDYLFDLDPETYSKVMESTQYVAQILKVKLNCKRVCVIVEGYEIPHAHIKLIPTNEASDLRDIPQKASDEELVEVYKKLTE